MSLTNRRRSGANNVLTVTDRHTIRAGLSAVFDCVWNADLWPKITPHVKRIEFLEASDRAQKMRMTVLSNGTEHTVESLREADPGRLVTYRQTKPPAFLTAHDGEWHFSVVPEGVQVDLVHRAVVDYDKALPALNVASADEADALIGTTLKNNGARTLIAIKDYLERRGA
jgi:ribosome-associated toxin RatA of RatAB toxin-antitoxin module